MKNLLRLVTWVASAAFFFAGAALAQTGGTVTNHAFAIGKGPGVTGFASLLCATTQVPIGQTSADPICRTVTGDVTINASGVTAIGAGKVTNTMIAGMTSAQLAAILSDETGSGAAYFVGGALGTPSSGVLTNATGLPLSGLASQAAYTLVGNATGSSAVPTAVDIAALTTKASPASTDYVVISDQAASGAWKKATVSSVGTASGISSVNALTGALTYGPGGSLPARTILTADTTYYWRNDGSNANAGTANTSGGAWADPQYGLNWILNNVDANGFAVTLANSRVGTSDTYSPPGGAGNAGGLLCSRSLASAGFSVGTIGNVGKLILQGQTGGDITTIDGTTNAVNAVTVDGGCHLQLQSLTLKSNIVSLFTVSPGSVARYNTIVWRGTPCAGCADVYASRGGYIEKTGSDSIATGNSGNHFAATHHGIIWNGAGTTTYLNNVTYGSTVFSFQYTQGLGEIIHTGTAAYSVGAFTVNGQRCYSESGGYNQHAGSGTTFLPGNAVCTQSVTAGQQGFLLE